MGETEKALARLEAGVVFARDFRVVRPLSRGGMGEVWVVEQLSTAKLRALKTMMPSLVVDPRARERFAQEARVGAQIGSENVVEVIAAGIDDNTGTPWLAMELLDGEDLANLMARRGLLPPGEAREILEQLCGALARAHERGIVHRDLKPENVFIDRTPRRGVAFLVKVLDFGIATLMREGVGAATVTTAIGSPLWMAPEQAQHGAKVRPSTDVWALGLIAFRLLSGKNYWQGANVPDERFNLPALLVEVMTAEVAPASSRAAALEAPGSLPAGFDGWFARCVARQAEARYPDAGAALAALLPLLGPADDPPRTSGPPHAATVAFTGVTAPPEATSPAPLPPMPTPSTVALDAAELRRAVDGPAIATVAMSSRAAATAPTAPPERGGAMVVGILGVLTLGSLGVWFARRPSPTTAHADAGAETAVELAPAPTVEPDPPALPPAPAPEERCAEGMVRVDGGLYWIGPSPDGTYTDPRHAVRLSTFCIGRTEVTAGDYARCVAAGTCTAADRVVGSEMTSATRRGLRQWCTSLNPALADHPINCVTWFQARDYCAWTGARLPTEAEWEAAARGGDERTYPWGTDSPTPQRLNLCDADCVRMYRRNGVTAMRGAYTASDGWGATAPVGSFPQGASPFGALDLAGNVHEWTTDWFASYPTQNAMNARLDPIGPAEGSHRVLRGGSWESSTLQTVASAQRSSYPPTGSIPQLGFRCAAHPRS